MLAAKWSARLHHSSASGTERDPVGSHFFPPLYKQSVGFEELADLRALEPNDFFKNGNEDGNGIVAEHGAAGDLRNVFGFGNRNREASRTFTCNIT